jgi:hypothetical protein
MTMNSTRARWATMLLIAGAALLGLLGCGGSSESSSSDEAARVEHVEGTDLSRVILTPEAAQRLDIHTAPVRRAAGGTEIPYSAVFYETNGETWAYVTPAPLTFVRERIVVDRIDGDRALLSSGPSPGTKVATVGVAELYGAESGIDGGGH